MITISFQCSLNGNLSDMYPGFYQHALRRIASLLVLNSRPVFLPSRSCAEYTKSFPHSVKLIVRNRNNEVGKLFSTLSNDLPTSPIPADAYKPFPEKKKKTQTTLEWKLQRTFYLKVL
jgi:hypothetical protein